MVFVLNLYSTIYIVEFYVQYTFFYNIINNFTILKINHIHSKNDDLYFFTIKCFIDTPRWLCINRQIYYPCLYVFCVSLLVLWHLFTYSGVMDSRHLCVRSPVNPLYVGNRSTESVRQLIRNFGNSGPYHDLLSLVSLESLTLCF